MTWKQVISICSLIVGITGCVPIPYYAGAGEIASVDLDVGKIVPLRPDEAVAFYSGSYLKPDDNAVECMETVADDENRAIRIIPASIFEQRVGEVDNAHWKDFYRPGPHVKTAARDAVKKITSDERIRYLVRIDTQKRALEEAGTKIDAEVAYFSSGDEELTLVATIVEAESGNKLGTATIVVREDTTAGFVGVHGMPPVGVMVFGITLMADTACKEMANQLIKVFRGGEGS